MSVGSHTEDRHPRLREALDLILKCWTSEEPFDWDGKYWQGKSIVATPRPSNAPHMPIATATDNYAHDRACRQPRVYAPSQLEPASFIRRKADRYARAAKAGGGRETPLGDITVARYVHLADSRREAMEDLRPAITYGAWVPDRAAA